MSEVAPPVPSFEGLERDVHDACVRAKAASRVLAHAPFAQRRAAVLGLAAGVRAASARIVEANEIDLARATAEGMAAAQLDRLALGEARIEALARAVVAIANADDVLGVVVARSVRPNGLQVERVRVALGVVALIYEARPNVTIDAAALAIHAGNAIVLRGGREALQTNLVLADIAARALASAGLPSDAVALLPFTSREAVRALVGQAGLVDLAIPRGGEGLIRYVTEHARVPVVQHYKGVCHLYLDAGVDLAKALAIAVNGKLSRPSVCNATEAILVAREDAARVVAPVVAALQAGGCEVRGCEAVVRLASGVVPATAADYGVEFLAPIALVVVVDGLAGALAHIAAHGSEHTEAIVTPHVEHAERFAREVAAACVVVNASTRFHDGGELGLGAELGIATSRLHWRGPMGVEALTTMKWIVRGEGQVRN